MMNSLYKESKLPGHSREFTFFLNIYYTTVKEVNMIMINTKVFSEFDIEEALTEFETFCSDEEIEADDIINVSLISRNPDKQSSVVLIYDDDETEY